MRRAEIGFVWPNLSIIGPQGGPPPRRRGFGDRRFPSDHRLGSFGAVVRRTLLDTNLFVLGICVTPPQLENWVRSAKIARFSARRVRRIEKERGGGPGPPRMRRRLSDGLRRREPPASYDPRGTARFFMNLENISENFAGCGGEEPNPPWRGWAARATRSHPVHHVTGLSVPFTETPRPASSGARSARSVSSRPGSLKPRAAAARIVFPIWETR